MTFKQLHQEASPVLICNVWDVKSAELAQKLNYPAIGTSSGAIATMLGYSDGENISFEELAYIVGRITQTTDIPLTVDLEAGYSRNPTKIVEHIKRLEQLGVVGINIEDSIVKEERAMVDASEFSKLLDYVCTALNRQNIDIFVNVRTDSFLLGFDDAVNITIDRAVKYANAGAQGLFVPCIVKEEDIEQILQKTELPLNVMCMPNLPTFSILKKLGVKRISMGNFVYNKISSALENELNAILQNHSFQNLFA